MFSSKKTLSSILSTFTKTMKDLGEFSEKCQGEIAVFNDQVRIAEENIQTAVADRNKADRVLTNLQKIVESE